MDRHVKITGVLTPKPGRAAALQALLLETAPHSRAEPGNLRWDIWREQGADGRFVLDELYRDDAAVAAHRASPHFQHYLAEVGALAERLALVLDPLQVG